MAIKKEQLSQEEKVAAILNKVNKANVGKLAVPVLDISSKCKRCGRTLSALEKITFYDRCADCTAELAANSREQFFKRYVMLAIVYVTGLLLAVFLSGSESSVSKLLGTIFQAVVTGVSVMYVAYKVLPKVLPNVKQKTILWISMGFAFGVDSAVMAITVSIGKDVLFYCCCVAFLAFVIYDAYHDYAEINHRYNLLAVYRRKSLDEEYVKEVSESVKANAIVINDTLNNEIAESNAETDNKFVKDETKKMD
jgi:hypothetical protein